MKADGPKGTTTIAGISHLRKAAEILRRDGDGSAIPLLGGASEVWSAMFDLDEWPTELRSKALELQMSLFRYGPIRTTVAQMVEPERLQLRRELLELADAAERLDAASNHRTEEASAVPEATR